MKLKVGHRTYTVRAMTKKEHTHEDGCLGLCKKRAAEILVWPAVSPCDQADTLLHEILHACWDVMHLGDEVREETAVSNLSSSLCQVFRDNPGLIETIRMGLDGTPIFGTA